MFTGKPVPLHEAKTDLPPPGVNFRISSAFVAATNRSPELSSARPLGRFTVVKTDRIPLGVNS